MKNTHERKNCRLLMPALAVCLALCGLALGPSGTAWGATITPFDAPGAGTGAQQGTIASSINDVGAITGNYADASNVNHGFLRAADGTFTTFDAPGAGTGPVQGTVPFGINLAGTITGEYIDGSAVRHGFLRAPDGTITTFDAPGAGNSAKQGTFPNGINVAGPLWEST